MNPPNNNHHSGGGSTGSRGQQQQNNARRDRGRSDNRRRRSKNKKSNGGSDAAPREAKQTGRELRLPPKEEDLTKPLPVKTHVKRRYGVVFYDNHAQAKNDAARLAELKAEVDQLNIVIRAEGDMDDPELTRFGKVFAGAAWALIHERRQTDGWYNEPR